MYQMFDGCTNLTSVPLLDTSSTTNMSGMFWNCSNLESVPLFNTSNVTSMSQMFMQCYKLSSIPLFYTSNVTGMESMFPYCSYLVSVPVLDTHNVISMNMMFSSCPRLSNESLNNILTMCANVSSNYVGTKTLKGIGLSSTQADTCQTLSNYQAFIAAGWTTGY
jgi:surface protein